MNFVLAVMAWFAIAVVVAAVEMLAGTNVPRAGLLLGTPGGAVISLIAIVILWRVIAAKRKPEATAS